MKKSPYSIDRLVPPLRNVDYAKREAGRACKKLDRRDGIEQWTNTFVQYNIAASDCSGSAAQKEQLLTDSAGMIPTYGKREEQWLNGRS
jgi:hypothetical protein